MSQQETNPMPDQETKIDPENIKKALQDFYEESRLIDEVIIPLVSTDEKSLEKLLGRKKEIAELTRDCIFQLYPTTTPVEINMEPLGLSREEQSALSTSIELGDFESLDPEKLPFLKQLSEETLYQLRRDALTKQLEWWQKEEAISQNPSGFKTNDEAEEPWVDQHRNQLANQRIEILRLQQDELVRDFGQNHPTLFNKPTA